MISGLILSEIAIWKNQKGNSLIKNPEVSPRGVSIEKNILKNRARPD
jgi:hypothetical protein